jgi:hypothetical protein
MIEATADLQDLDAETVPIHRVPRVTDPREGTDLAVSRRAAVATPNEGRLGLIGPFDCEADSEGERVGLH